MGGGNDIKNSQSQEQSIAQQQLDASKQLGTEGTTLINQGEAEKSPLSNFLRAIIGGDSTTTNTALAPVIGNITKTNNATKENIYTSTAPGAGRDVLLGEAARDKGTAVASATNDAYLKAFPELASLGAGETSAGLGLTGAGITSTSNAATTTGDVLKSQEQQKASTLDLFGQLAGTAGKVVTGGVGKF